MKWSIALTTVPERRKDLLPRTLASLVSAGFPKPRLHIDGEKNPKSWVDEFGCEVTAHWPVIKPYGNWTLALIEQWVREPFSQFFAIVQDDVVFCRNVREYVEMCLQSKTLPTNGYLNLYTVPANRSLATKRGWFASNQLGQGALALVFPRESLMALFANQKSLTGMAEKVMNATAGHRNIDGAIVTAFKRMGQFEYCHFPSLCQHTGQCSTMATPPRRAACSFPGEDYDVVKLLGMKTDGK